MELTPLLHLDIDILKFFPLDHMHLVCLGSLQRLLTIILKGGDF
jgi:hypothetical protein